MKSQWMLCVMIAGMFALAGCQSNHSIVRGQTPGPMGSPGCGAMPCPQGPRPGPMYYNGPAGIGPMGCPPGHNHQHGAECPLCAPDNFWTPTHHHTYDYQQPKNLVYPPQNQPAAAVVYPYYTLKGPSDFFMK
ncbi:MAG: hypothetical protein ACKV2Q_22415 [Planctomycetaceae bacterium]